MHKRSYVRANQEERPWVRVQPISDTEEDNFQFAGKQTVRWTAGNRRDRETRVLTAHIRAVNKKLFLHIFMRDEELFSDVPDSEVLPRRNLQLSWKLRKLGQKYSIAQSKNSCLFSGKGSTYNRFLFVSRQTLRSLTRFGFVSGLVSGKRD